MELHLTLPSGKNLKLHDGGKAGAELCHPGHRHWGGSRKEHMGSYKCSAACAIPGPLALLSGMDSWWFPFHWPWKISLTFLFLASAFHFQIDTWAKSSWAWWPLAQGLSAPGSEWGEGAGAANFKPFHELFMSSSLPLALVMGQCVGSGCKLKALPCGAAEGTRDYEKKALLPSELDQNFCYLL